MVAISRQPFRLPLGLALPTTCLLFAISAIAAGGAEVTATVVDADSGEPVAARIYLRDAAGKWLHVEGIGKAVPYSKSRSLESTEIHTSISAEGFRFRGPAGDYRLTVERGKEYLTHEQTIELNDTPVTLTIRLKRWIRMADRGWYSGETHVHRSMAELPTAMLAEDLNVGLPLTHWVTRSNTPPVRGDRNSDASEQANLVRLDETHVIYPMNTEYEIFSVGIKRHTLGAVFALNHKQPLALGAPPVKPIADEVRRQGGILELDKHNWPWSMMLPPIMNVDLYELTNNHLWRTKFHYHDFGEAPAEYMRAEQDPRGGVTEWGWLQFTFENYYALLNCGFPMKPTAGCASGVHPVPLGFGRVYVHQPKGFDYDGWMDGLAKGRSFVSTGPMMDIRFNGRQTDQELSFSQPAKVSVRGWIESPRPIAGIELLDAGEVVLTIDTQGTRTEAGAYRFELNASSDVDSTTWLAVRCFTRTPEGRIRFAHTAPMHIRIGESKLKPRPEQARYLLRRVEEERARNRGVLDDAAMDEYRRAAEFYGNFLDR